MVKSMLTTILLKEVNVLLAEVEKFFKECCEPTANDEKDILEVDGKIAFTLSNESFIRVQMRKSEPQPYAETLFRPLSNEMQVPLPYYMPTHEPEDDDNDLDAYFAANDDIKHEANDILSELIEENDEKSSFPDISVTLHPKSASAKSSDKQNRYRCDKCGRSWAYRKGMVYHKARGKCSQEPRWIRWTRGRPLCIHPDCHGKQNVEFTYSAMMKHIMDEHTTPETSVSDATFLFFFPNAVTNFL